jgi:hypothetical protein
MADDGIRVAKAYIDITTNVDETMASTRNKIKASTRDIESAGNDTGAALDKGMADGITKGGKSKAAAKKSGEDSGKAYAKGASDEITKDKSVEKSVARQGQFSVAAFAGMFAGLPVVAAVGALGTATALSVVPLAFVAMSAAALKGNAEVADSFAGLKTHVVTNVTDMSQVMAGPLAGAAKDLGASFDRMSPQIQAATNASVPAVRTLTGAVTDFAELAMPGLVTAAQSSRAPLEGLRSLAGQTGAGVSTMLANMAGGASDAGASMVMLGGTVNGLEGFVGSLVAALSHGAVGVLPQFNGALSQVEGLTLKLATNGMPLLTNAASGFMGTAGGLVGILGGVASGLGSWAGPLGTVGGSLLATNRIAGLFGTGIAETGGGLKAFASSVDDAGKKTTPFGTAVSGATGLSGKLKAGLGSVVSEGINPLGIGLGVVSLGLDLFGQAQQHAAEAAAEHKQAVQALTVAIGQDGGVVGDATKAVNQKALADKNAGANLGSYNISLATGTLAATGNAGAMKQVADRTNEVIDSVAKSAGLNAEQTTNLEKLGQQALTSGGNFDTFAKAIGDNTVTMVANGQTGAQAISKLTDADRVRLQQLFNGTGAIGEQVKAQKEAVAADNLSQAALDNMTVSQVQARAAWEKTTTAIFNQQNAQLGYRGAVLNVQDAEAALDKVNRSSNSTSSAKEHALLAVEQAMAGEEKAAYDNAVANSKAGTDAGKAADGFRAQNTEAIKLADTFKGNLPPSLAATVAALDETSARAGGAKVSFNALGQEVYVLPSGKQIVVTTPGMTPSQSAMDLLKGKVLDVPDDKTIHATGLTQDAVTKLTDLGYQITHLPDGSFNVTGVVSWSQGTSGQAAKLAMLGRAVGAIDMPIQRNVGFAAGGLPAASQANQLTAGQVVQPGDMRWAGDAKVPELFLPLDDSRRSRDLLASANQLMPAPSGSAGGGSAGGGSPMGSSTGTVINNYITVNPPAGASSSDTAALVAAELGWQLRNA